MIILTWWDINLISRVYLELNFNHKMTQSSNTAYMEALSNLQNLFPSIHISDFNSHHTL